jgi:hypothetical protein
LKKHQKKLDMIFMPCNFSNFLILFNLLKMNRSRVKNLFFYFIYLHINALIKYLVKLIKLYHLNKKISILNYKWQK